MTCRGAVVLLLLLALSPFRSGADDRPAEADLKAAEAAAAALYQELVNGEPSGLLRGLDAAPLKQETYARLSARGVRFFDAPGLTALDALFDQALEGVCKGIAADLKGMRSEITGRWMKDGRAFIVAHGERLPDQRFTILEMARVGDGWRIRSFAQPLLPLDLPEQIIGMMVGDAQRQVESSGKGVEARLEAGITAVAWLALLAWWARRSAPERRMRARAIAACLWVAGIAGAWTFSSCSESPEARVRRMLFGLPEARVFLCLREARFDPAFAALDEALAAFPGDFRLLAWKACLFDQLRHTSAPPEIWKALLAYPSARVAAQYALTAASLQDGDFASAAGYLTRVLEAVGDDPYLKAKLLWMRARLGQSNDLEFEFVAALARAFSPTPILLFRAKSFAALGRRNRAIEDLNLLAMKGTLAREMVTKDQDLVPLLDDPRVQELVGKLPAMKQD